MNKPKRKTYVKRYGCEHTERYIQALETYSHELEIKYNDLKHFLEIKEFPSYYDKKEIEQLNKALDKACNKLFDSMVELDGEAMINSEQWKEWLMKDE